jgi:hypothetical protein
MVWISSGGTKREADSGGSPVRRVTVAVVSRKLSEAAVLIDLSPERNAKDGFRGRK